ncbi:MAG: hypothetical protein JJU18_11615 [Oceanicaulis sp.]|nr:hypothetical protein [Oceanicaulis sp.]
MITKGLKESEKQLLASAGFAPDAVRVIANEAERLRWLFLQRPAAAMIWWGAAFAAAIVISALWEVTGWWGVLAAPVLAAASQLLFNLPDFEINASKSNDPPRWAARRMAQLSVKAAGAGIPEQSKAFSELHAHAEAGGGLSSPWSVLRIIAGRLTAPKGGASPASSARKTASSGENFGATLRFGAVIVAVTVIIIALALGARPF